MIKNNKALFIPAIIFILSELIFGIVIQAVGGSVICFSSVVLALLFSLYSLAVFSRNSDGTLTTLALLFTVCADFCLVIMEPREQLLSMIFFSSVQLLYFARLCMLGKGKKELIIHLACRLAAIAVALILTAIVLRDKTDSLSLVSMFYYANLLINLVYSVRYFKSSLLLPIGLLCFILCDTLVGLSELGSLYLNVSEDSLIYKLTHTELNLIWLFYVPSQTLLALSPIEIIMRRRNKKNVDALLP